MMEDSCDCGAAPPGLQGMQGGDRWSRGRTEDLVRLTSADSDGVRLVVKV